MASSGGRSDMLGVALLGDRLVGARAAGGYAHSNSPASNPFGTGRTGRDRALDTRPPLGFFRRASTNEERR